MGDVCVCVWKGCAGVRFTANHVRGLAPNEPDRRPALSGKHNGKASMRLYLLFIGSAQHRVLPSFSVRVRVV